MRSLKSFWPLRLPFARQPNTLSRCPAVIIRAIETDLIHRAGLTRANGARSGIVTLVQRFGSALNLNPINVDKLVNGSPANIVDSGSFPVYLMTFTNTGPGDASNVIVNIDIGEFLAFGVDSQGGLPFTYTDVGTPSLPTNFLGTPQVSLNRGPFQAMSASPAYNPDITAIQILMNGTMPVCASFTLRYQCLVD